MRINKDEVVLTTEIVETSKTYEPECKHFFLKQDGRSQMADNTTYEQWSSEGSVESSARARKRAGEMLAAYEAPAIDPAIDEALRAFIDKRMEELPDTDY